MKETKNKKEAHEPMKHKAQIKSQEKEQNLKAKCHYINLVKAKFNFEYPPPILLAIVE